MTYVDRRKPRYVLAQMPEHPRAYRNGTVLEHVLVAERALGRLLPERSVIHHVDEDGKNNTPSNLVVCEDTAYHQLLHRRMRALAATGNPNALPCNVCRQYDLPENMRVFIHTWKGRPNARTTRAYHSACKSEQAARNARMSSAASARKFPTSGVSSS